MSFDGLTFADITHPDDIAGHRGCHEPVDSPGPIPEYSLEKRYLRKDGSVDLEPDDRHAAQGRGR